MNWTTPRLTPNEVVQAKVRIEKTRLDGKPQSEAFILRLRVNSVRGNVAELSVDQGGAQDGENVNITYDASREQFFRDGKVIKSDGGVGLFYNPALWGAFPENVHSGQEWTAHVDPWAEGPAGNAKVRVLSVDAANEDVVLVCDGVGRGPSTRAVTARTTIDGKSVPTPVVFGTSKWHGRLELRHGFAASEEFRITTQVTLEQTGSVPARHASSSVSETLVNTSP